MKLYLLLFLFVVGSLKLHSQQYYQLYYNIDLQAQVTANHGVRIASEKLYQSSYEKQSEWYEDANEKLIQVVTMKNHIYSTLKNVNHALKQGKQVERMYFDFVKLIENMAEMLELTAQKPQYSALVTRMYRRLYEAGYNAYNSINDQVMKEDTDYLMDSYDRQYLLNKIHREIKIMNGWTLHISNYLRNAEKKPYFRHVKFLNNWYVQDKAMITRIISNYGNNINNW